MCPRTKPVFSSPRSRQYYLVVPTVKFKPAKCSMPCRRCVACSIVCISQSALAAPCVGLVQHKAQYRYLPRVPVTCQRPSQGRVLWPHAWLSTIKRYLFLIISATLKPMVTRPRAHWFPLSTFLCFTYLSLFYTPSPNFVLVITRLPFPTLRAEGREFYRVLMPSWYEWFHHVQ